MMRRSSAITLLSAATLLAAATPARAQQAVTITGHVSANALPLRGASVRIDAVDASTSTNGEGRYSFIIPSTKVRGQVVTMTATYPRFRKQSIEIELVGGSLVREFELTSNDSPAPRADTSVRDTTRFRPLRTSATDIRVRNERRLDMRGVAGLRAWSAGVTVDTSAFSSMAGLTSIAGALTGRVAGLDVQTSSALGGTTSVVVRGERSIIGLTQPLVVVNGVIVDNSNLAAALQRSGLGGFDYGTTLGDFNLEDVASVAVLSGPSAAMRFGGRGANGALLVTLKDARGLNGFEVSASQQLSNSKVLRLPRYQNVYGQGLNGQFGFFDGKGGGVNDATDESWGPALNGAPVAQASFAEAGRAEVRPFLAMPNNVDNYFGTGRTFATNLGLQGGNESGHLRASLSNQLDDGLTPGTSITRRSATATGDYTVTSRLGVSGNIQLYSLRGEDRPGSGFDESNPVSGFSHTPRQLEFPVFELRTRDASGAQLSWNYSGRNNPYFATVENDNHDDRTRVIGGGTAEFRISSRLTAIAQGGADHSTEGRSFSVASGWMGGFPYYLGKGDFSSGGFENDDITRTASNVDVMLQTSAMGSGALTFSLRGGAGYRSDDVSLAIRGSDKLADANASAPVNYAGSVGTSAIFASVDTRFRGALAVNLSVREESSSPSGAPSSSTFYPALTGSLDLTGFDSLRSANARLQSLILHGGVSRAGNDATGALLQRVVYQPVIAGAPSQIGGPETTTGFELGAAARFFRSRLSLDVTGYSERSEHLIFGSSGNTGVITNAGVTLSATLVPVRMENGLEWTTGVNVGHNSNMVESLSDGVSSVTLGTPFSNLSVVARPGLSLGSLVGTQYLRNSTGQLVLRDGRPVVDSASGPVFLGETEPSWFGGLTSTVTRGIIRFDVLVDARHGGKIFSASNRAGAVSGVLEETANRPDSGIVVPGTDATGTAPNTAHVTTEQYYHSLAPIAERWVYDASYVKLRELRLSVNVPLTRIPVVQAQSLRLAFIGRNLALWSSAPNIDPETVLSTSTYRGVELGQLPTARTLGFQLTLTP